MLNVFVSRPTWVAPEFRAGLAGFLRFLQSLDLNPRTLGTTDYPSRAPLDEIIDLLGECVGAVILGYPQIYASSGYVLDQPIEQLLVLPTEWNHIEAGLAYARGLPLLVIHHDSIFRGIFDRGASPTFLYKRNLALPEWPLADDLQGAVANWKQKCLQPLASGAHSVHAAGSSAQKRKPKRTDINGNIERPDVMAKADVLRKDNPAMHILSALARLPDEYQLVRDVATEADEPVVKTRFFLQGLQKIGHADHAIVQGEKETRYRINNAGISVLLEHNAL